MYEMNKKFIKEEDFEKDQRKTRDEKLNKEKKYRLKT